MRRLNKKQKKLLDNWLEENKDIVTTPGNVIEDYMPPELLKKLEQINDFETIYTHINCYIDDKISQDYDFVKKLW